MQRLPEEKRKKTKPPLIKVVVMTILFVLFAGLLFFTNASKFIENKPAKSCSSVFQSLLNIPAKVPDTDQGSQTDFSKDIAVGEETQTQTETSKEENNAGSDNNTENTGSENIDIEGTSEEEANAEKTSTEITTIEDTSENTDAEDTSVETANIDNVNSDSFAAALLNMINTTRLENGLPALNINQTVNAVAQYRSQDMIERNYFSHQTPEGKSIGNILQESGIMFASCGENIQYASPPSWANPELFFNSWMNSDLHRANILSGNFSQIGIGVSNNDDRLVAVLVFIN